MRRLKVRVVGLAVAMPCCMVAGGCRDSAQRPDPLSTNLGSSTQPVIPRPVLVSDTRIADGQATLVPLQEASELEAAESSLEDAEALADLIKQYKNAYRTGDTEAIVGLHVERQRGGLADFLAVVWELRDAVRRLESNLGDGTLDPSVAGQIEQIMRVVDELPLDPATVVLDSETEATLSMPESGILLKFEKQDGRWLVFDPTRQGEADQAQLAQLKAAVKLVRSLADVYEDESLTPKKRRAKLASLVGGGVGADDADSKTDAKAGFIAPTGLRGAPTDGGDLFARNRCARCHCPDARGGCGREAPKIQGVAYEKINERLRGTRFHPGGKYQLTDQELAHLAAFLKSLEQSG